MCLGAIRENFFAPQTPWWGGSQLRTLRRLEPVQPQPFGPDDRQAFAFRPAAETGQLTPVTEHDPILRLAC